MTDFYRQQAEAFAHELVGDQWKGKRQRNGDNVRGTCPLAAHPDQHPSFSYTVVMDAYCCSCSSGKGSELRERLGYIGHAEGPNDLSEPRIVATYDYCDEHGALLFQVVRFMPKQFRQRRPDDNGGWVWKLNGVRMVLYRLPELLEAGPEKLIFIVEGEKDVDNMLTQGLVATCNPMGAGKWRDEFSQNFKDMSVCVIADKDDAGRNHARQVAHSLKNVARTIRILELPGKNVKDASDFLALRHTGDEILKLALEAAIIPAHGFHVMSAAELTAMTEPDIDWLWEDLFALPGISCVAARPKVGKTTLYLEFAIAVAGGADTFLGRKIKHGPVIFLAIEEQKRAVAKKLNDLKASELPIWVQTGPVHLKALDDLQALIREKSVVLCIIDTYIKFARVTKIEDNAENAPILEKLQAIGTETGCHISISHHTKKGQSDEKGDVLGATAIMGGVETILTLMKKPDGVRTLETVQRYGRGWPEEVVVQMNQDGRLEITGSRDEFQMKEIKPTIIDFVKGNPGMTEPEIRQGVGKDGTTVGRALRELLSEKTLCRKKEPDKDRAYHYYPDPVLEKEESSNGE